MMELAALTVAVKYGNDDQLRPEGEKLIEKRLQTKYSVALGSPISRHN
jgi:hypothetical protein